jgi:hypothetical protein
VRTHTKITLALAAAALLASAGAAHAQDDPVFIDPDTVPPTATDPGEYPQAMPPPQQPAGAIQPEAGGPTPAGTTPPGGELWIDAEGGTVDEQPRYGGGLVPEIHVVRSGDTLWDICGYYFSDPWRWPKVWSWNPTITNPHWIYPGDVVRLWGPGEAAPTPAEPTPDTSPRIVSDERLRSTGVELRQLAFVGAEDLKTSAEITGSTEDKVMLTEGDEVFLTYPSGKPPQIGKRYAIYDATEPVAHPETGAKVGAYVELRGELQITEVKKDKKARGQVTYVTGVIERGHRVGPIKTQFKDIEPVVADRNLEGIIVAVIDDPDLIGEGAVVFVDRGKKDGVKPGNVFQVVRRGDAYDPEHKLPKAGQDDRRFPDERIGEIIVVDTANTLSVGLMTTSIEEAFVGDHVVLRKGR